MSIAIPQGATMAVRRSLGSLVPHPAEIGKVAGAHMGIAPMKSGVPHLAGGGIANASAIQQSMFSPIQASSIGIPSMDINFISSPSLQAGSGPPHPTTIQPQKQQSGAQDANQALGAANGATSLYKTLSGPSSSTSAITGAAPSGITGAFANGANPNVLGGIQSGLAGNGYGGILTGPNAQSSLGSGIGATNGFGPGASLDTIAQEAGENGIVNPAATAGLDNIATAAGTSDLAETAAAGADAITDASTAAAAAPGVLDFLAALFADGGAVKGYADGGDIANPANVASALLRREAGETFHPSGLLNSAGFGRTDTINTNVPTGAYVIPADVVSGLGEGNSLAGASVIDRMFGTSPYGVNAPHIGHGKGPPHAEAPRPEPPPTGVQPGPTVNTSAINSAGAYAKGGKISDHPSVAPVVVAGGEHVLSPQQIINKFGSLKRGHKILDHWVVMQRQKIAKEMLKLPNPVGSKVKT